MHGLCFTKDIDDLSKLTEQWFWFKYFYYELSKYGLQYIK